MVALPSALTPIPRDQRPDRHLTPEAVSFSTVSDRIFGLVRVVRERDLLTFEHSRRVAIYAQRLARALGLDRAQARQCALAGLLHDAGKVWMPQDILNKRGPLTSAEYAKIQAHALIGERLITSQDIPEFFAQATRSHHEAFDGRGYPDGLIGEAIPWGARLVAIADTFDVITSDRPYKVVASVATALAEIARGRGSQFDPLMVDTFVALAAAQPQFLALPRICAVEWNGARSAAYQIATGF